MLAVGMLVGKSKEAGGQILGEMMVAGKDAAAAAGRESPAAAKVLLVVEVEMVVLVCVMRTALGGRMPFTLGEVASSSSSVQSAGEALSLW
jgi:hypothetical protein